MARTTMAVVAIVPEPLAKRLERAARLLDPDAEAALPPHVPLVEPFEAEPSFLPLEQHCWKTGHERAPFRVELGEPVLDDEEGFAYLPVTSGEDEVSALRDRLLTGKYAPAGRGAPEPHRVVVARLGEASEQLRAEAWETITGTGLRGAAGQRPAGSDGFFVERFQLMARYPDGTWYERDFYTLDRAVRSA